MINIVVLISGNGSTLQAIMDAIQTGLDVTISAILCNQPDAYGIQRAKAANLPTHILNHRDFESREAFDSALIEQIDAYQPDLVVLAGFMRRLENAFVDHYAGKLINIHPSLLPKYPGLHTHRKALAAGDLEHGTSIHFVTKAVDAGPLIAQTRIDVHPNDTEATLKDRVQAAERRLYPAVLALFAAGRITLNKDTVLLDDQPIDPTQVLGS